MSRIKQDPLEKKLLMIGRIAEKIGLESVEYNATEDSIKVTFKTKEPLEGNKKTPLSKKDEEELNEIARNSELEEMRHLDPLTYEEGLIQGTIKE